MPGPEQLQDLPIEGLRPGQVEGRRPSSPASTRTRPAGSRGSASSASAPPTAPWDQRPRRSRQRSPRPGRRATPGPGPLHQPGRTARACRPGPPGGLGGSATSLTRACGRACFVIALDRRRARPVDPLLDLQLGRPRPHGRPRGSRASAPRSARPEDQAGHGGDLDQRLTTGPRTVSSRTTTRTWTISEKEISQSSSPPTAPSAEPADHAGPSQ